MHVNIVHFARHRKFLRRPFTNVLPDEGFDVDNTLANAVCNFVVILQRQKYPDFL